MIGKVLDHYSPQEVPGHQVLVSFNGDDDALMFREWWAAKGWEAFANYRTGVLLRNRRAEIEAGPHE